MEGMIHGFINLTTLIPACHAAFTDVAEAVKVAFDGAVERAEISGPSPIARKEVSP